MYSQPLKILSWEKEKTENMQFLKGFGVQIAVDLNLRLVLFPLWIPTAYFHYLWAEAV